MNKETYPFYFFIEVLETNRIETLKNEFYSSATGDWYSTKGEWIDRIEFDNQQTGYKERWYLKDFLQETFQAKKVELIPLLDNVLFQNKDVNEAIKRLKILYSSWLPFEEKARKSKLLKKYGLDKIYVSISELLVEKEKALQGSKGVERRFEKIHWLADGTLLAELFFKLFYTQANNGEAYIKTKKGNLEKFIAESFIYKDGTEVSPSSMRTYLQPNRTEDRKNTGMLKQLFFRVGD